MQVSTNRRGVLVGGGENRGFEVFVAALTVAVGWSLAEFCSDMSPFSRYMARSVLHLLLSKFIMTD